MFKKKYLLIILFVSLICFAYSEQIVNYGEIYYIAIQNAELKSSKNFFAEVTASLDYGTPVTVLSTKDKWFEVADKSSPSVKGWIAANSLSKRKIIVNKYGTGTSATTEELSLAGKGFSPEVEKQYKTENAELDYLEVNKIEGIKVDTNELLRFIDAGELKGGNE